LDQAFVGYHENCTRESALSLVSSANERPFAVERLLGSNRVQKTLDRTRRELSIDVFTNEIERKCVRISADESRPIGADVEGSATDDLRRRLRSKRKINLHFVKMKNGAISSR
jgi:hypothetical protein